MPAAGQRGFWNWLVRNAQKAPANMIDTERWRSAALMSLFLHGQPAGTMLNLTYAVQRTANDARRLLGRSIETSLIILNERNPFGLRANRLPCRWPAPTLF